MNRMLGRKAMTEECNGSLYSRLSATPPHLVEQRILMNSQCNSMPVECKSIIKEKRNPPCYKRSSVKKNEESAREPVINKKKVK